jgi:hypothetical protein
MKNFIALFVFISLFIGVSAQDDEFQVPKKYQMKTPEESDKYKEDIVKCIDWLMETPANVQKNKRASANKFFLKWIEMTKDVSILLHPKILTFMDNPDLFAIFAAGWAKDVLDSNDNHRDAYRGCLAGVNAVIDYYQKNKDYIPKNKGVEKYIKLKEKGKLESSIEKITSKINWN